MLERKYMALQHCISIWDRPTTLSQVLCSRAAKRQRTLIGSSGITIHYL